MIQTTMVNGRPAHVAYIGANHTVVDEVHATLIKVRFTDEEGGAVFLMPDKSPPTKQLKPFTREAPVYMKTKALALAKKNGFAAEQIRFSDKLEWIEVEGKLVLRKARIDYRAKVITLFTEAIEANFPKTFEQHSLEVLADCIKTLGNGQWDEEEHPRDSDGKFAHGGGGSAPGVADEAKPEEKPKEPELHPDVVGVEGDEWNRETAVRLEKEYQTAKPDLEALLHKSVGEEVDTAVDEDDLHENAPYVPDHWDGLSDSQQEDVKQAWMDNNKQSFMDDEQQNWYDSGGAKDAAQSSLAYEFEKGTNIEWAEEAIKEWKEARRENGEAEAPFTDVDLLDSLSIAYDSNGEGTGDVAIEFNDEILKKPTNGYDPNQGSLPGFEKIEPHEFLNDEMRESLKSELEKAFDKKADDMSDSMEVPDYLSENIEDTMDEYWDMKDSDEKWKIAENDTSIISDAQQEYDDYYANNGGSGDSAEVAIPDTFDPLQEEGGSDYKKTHALVTFMSRERGGQLLEQRGLIASGTKDDYKRDIADIDNQLWRDWKSSSAGSFGGQILQLASAEELGARYREMPTARQDLIKQADDKYKEIGGFAGVKALVRAKWETSQYALDKAGIHTLPVYRGLRVPMPENEPTQEVEVDTTSQYNDGLKSSRLYEKLTDAVITRNGMYSTTTNPSVANGWSAGHGTKVVLRIDAPRTAVVSFPAYGINVHSEKEVVLAGTAFRNWDAWKNNAPTVDEVPISKAKKAA